MELNSKKKLPLFKLNTKNILLLCGLAIGLYFFTFEIIGLNFKFFPGDLGDGRLNLYFLEHAFQFFTGKLNSFWDAPFMYPEQSMISYSDNLLGSAPIYSFFRIIGLDIYLSYQLWFITLSILNYLCAFYFLKYVFKNNYAAIIGAFIFAFSLALQSQLTHAQTFPRFAIPLSFLMAVKFSESFHPKYFLYTLLMLVYQIYCGIYLGFMLFIPLAIYLTLVLIKHWFAHKFSKIDLKWVGFMFVYTLICIAILLPLLLPYISRKISPSLEHYHQISHSIPTLKSYFFSQNGSLFWDFLSNTANDYIAFWDHQIFTGAFATLSLVIIILWFLKHMMNDGFKLTKLNNIHLLLLSGLITFILFLRADQLSLYIALYFIPGFSSMRSLTRVINVELIFFAFAVSFLVSKLIDKYSSYKAVLTLLLLLWVFLDNYFDGAKSYKTEVGIAHERTDDLEKLFSQIPQGGLVSYEPLVKADASIAYQIDAMLTAQKFGLKTINGYTATCPGEYGRFWNELDEVSRNLWLDGKNLQVDTLYVIQTNKITSIPVDKLKEYAQKQIYETKIQDKIKDIQANEEWLNVIKDKAVRNNIPLDSMIYLDAKWVVDQE